MPRNSPTPAEIASFRFFGIELMMYSRIRKIEIRKKITPEQNTAASACCQVYFIVKHDGEGEERIEPHAGRQRDRVIGIERHHHGGDRGGNAGGDEHRALVHAGIAENLRIDEDDVDHRQERGQAGDEFGADVAARLVQAEQAIEHGLRLLRAARSDVVHGLPPRPTAPIL